MHEAWAPLPHSLEEATACRNEIAKSLAELVADAADISARLAEAALFGDAPTSLIAAEADLAELCCDLVRIDASAGKFASNLASLIQRCEDAAFLRGDAAEANLQQVLANRIATGKRLQHLYSHPGLTPEAERRALHDHQTADALVRLAKQEHRTTRRSGPAHQARNL